MSGTEATTSTPAAEEKASAPAAKPSSTAAAETAAPAAATITPILSPEHPLETETDDNNDSALGDDAADSTASLTSSILKYRTIHGRTYHSEIGNAEYRGANDAGQNEAWEIMHHINTLSLDDKLYVAPIKEPKKALDIGTGTGIWAIDFADMHPGCEVIATDISPIQPTWVPPNLTCVIEECTQDWTFPENSFDYVHIRSLSGCIKDWTSLFEEAYKCLKPGGWLESFEPSPYIRCDNATLPPKSAVAQWGQLFVEASKITQRTVRVVDDGIQMNAMQEAGFVNLHEKEIKVPFGGWPAHPRLKEMGQFSRLASLQDVEGYILYVTNLLGWSREEISVFVAHMRKEVKAVEYNYYCTWKVVWAQKPEA